MGWLEFLLELKIRKKIMVKKKLLGLLLAIKNWDWVQNLETSLDLFFVKKF